MSKITWLNKNQKNLNSNEKMQSTDTNPKVAKVLELSDQNFKATIIKMT